MKTYSVLGIFLALVMILAPVLAIEFAPREETPVHSPQGSKENQSETKSNSIKVLSVSSGSVGEINMKEYIIGALAAEMPAAYHSQALKAQAVACYTYALYTRQLEEAEPSSSLKGAHISDESTVHQGYIDKAQRKEKWGDKFETYEKKLTEAVEEVFGRAVYYDGELINALFHAISSGQTESAKNVWGKDIKYLQPVQSPGDRLSPAYAASVSFTTEEFTAAAKALEGAKLNLNASEFIGEIKRSESDTVISIEIGGKSFSGIQVRNALGLASACFEVKYKEGTFTFATKGHGHNVGMSQYGADYMARQGSTWEEILKHYYTEVEIKAK